MVFKDATVKNGTEVALFTDANPPESCSLQRGLNVLCAEIKNQNEESERSVSCIISLFKIGQLVTKLKFFHRDLDYSLYKSSYYVTKA